MRLIALAILLSQTLPAPARAEAKLSEFCSIAMPAIQAPFSCTSERKSAELLETVLGSYRAICPGLQERFEALDQARQKLVHRCVLFNTNKREEPAGCAADRATTAQSLDAFKGEVNTMLDRVAGMAATVASDSPREATCRVFHEQHALILTILKDRLHNLRMAAERAERESRSAPANPKDHERLTPKKAE
jgi:hypothetical protein